MATNEKIPTSNPTEAFGKGVIVSKPQDAFGAPDTSRKAVNPFSTVGNFSRNKLLAIAAVTSLGAGALYVAKENNQATVHAKRFLKHGVGELACKRDFGNQQAAIADALESGKKVSVKVAVNANYHDSPYALYDDSEDSFSNSYDGPASDIVIMQGDSEDDPSFGAELNSPIRLTCKYDAGKHRLVGRDHLSADYNAVSFVGIKGKAAIMDDNNRDLSSSDIKYVTKRLHVSKADSYSGTLIDDAGVPYANAN
jgi:hypothetical protein